ncbi:MAG: glycine betaine ABC transporter substrate-binding protein [Acidimicrobiia bacterium]
MPYRPKTRIVGVLLIAVALVASACGSDDGAEGGALAEHDLSGIEIAVGSKDFDEQLILGEILVAAFQASGAEVDNKVNLGGTNVARAALESGDIDVYMEYNGTGWTQHLGLEDPSFDSEALTQGVRERDLAENDIHWLGRSPFNNTYGFVSSPELTEDNGGAFGIQTMVDYLEANPDASLCLESEFPSRSDGLVLTEEYAGYDIPDSQITILDTGVIYSETAANNCDFGEVFTTDGRIPALGLTLVEDPGVNIVYNISMNIRDDKYQEAPEAFDAIAELILAPLDNERMGELNARVSAEGEDPADVARDFLVEEGLISD